MKNFIQNGSNLTITNGATAVSSGDVVVIGDLVGVAVTDIAANAKGAIATQGVYEVDRASGSTLAVGDIGYLNSSGKITNTTTNNDAVGLVVAATTAKVELKIFGRKLA
jgi:predicted RecA/RadA family phage recombinase